MAAMKRELFSEGSSPKAAVPEQMFADDRDPGMLTENSEFVIIGFKMFNSVSPVKI